MRAALVLSLAMAACASDPVAPPTPESACLEVVDRIAAEAAACGRDYRDELRARAGCGEIPADDPCAELYVAGYACLAAAEWICDPDTGRPIAPGQCRDATDAMTACQRAAGYP